MVDEEAFRAFLRRAGRSSSAVERCLAAVRDFESWIGSKPRSSTPIQEDDVAGYVAGIETTLGKPAKTQLWALAYYFEFVDDPALRDLCRSLRRDRIDRAPFELKDLRGISAADAESLRNIGIVSVGQMLEAGRTRADREAVSAAAELPVSIVAELVALSDLARIRGIKGIRARLYFDAGIQSVAEMAAWEPEDLEVHLSRFCAETGFDGAAPLPAEVAFSVATARNLPPVVEW